jgi:hypothetical protein
VIVIIKKGHRRKLLLTVRARLVNIEDLKGREPKRGIMAQLGSDI